MAKPALGRGLGALMGGASAGAKPAAPAPARITPEPAQENASAGKPRGEEVLRVALNQIRPCAFQPRKEFGEEALKELADSIREQGILQPLIVRQKNGAFELIAGERRWRAAQIAGLVDVPVLVREADDRKVMELALIENLQRENLNPIEEALGYQHLIQEFSLTQEEAAIKVGKNRATVANLLRVLSLPLEVQNYLKAGLISFGHARAILGLSGPEAQKQMSEQVIREALSVRETENIIGQRARAASSGHSNNLATRPPRTADVHVADLQTRLQERFGTKVSVKYRKGRGAVEIRFYNDEDLERILGIAGVKMD